ncbi:MAG: glycerol kinase GlpK [Candidatus Dormibacteraeota bacterium]|uniref:ATP:glycerol 3-phosphotransferase n=1 Tax=Candidatus Aeolococcus gillhamiae TaxID=3127015 RepID=A0A934K0S4_9BACT|nr:glycerol kinase GlpK [Candidatus Dormibacteraeota bacterium]
MNAPRVLAIDQGTSGTTCLVVGVDGQIHGRAHVDVAVRYPRDGWVEQDAEELWRSVLAAARAAIDDAGGPAPVAIGITNQRETLVVFERDGLRPVAPAIVWQCRRSADLCAAHRDRGEEPSLRERTGLLLDPYFSATKMEWLLADQPALRARAERGDLCGGTVDTWLVARLSGGAALVTDASNASRTLLYDLVRGDFDDELCATFTVPPALLAEVRASAARVAVTDPDAFLGLRLPISGMAGDQQASLFGQACLQPGMSKNTYGTGSFVLVNTGTSVPSPVHGLLGTVAWRLGEQDTFALEGSIFVTGAGLSWLRDGLGLIAAADEAGPLFDSVPDTNGCIFIPALVGLGAPYWDPAARGALLGLSAGVTRAHVVRAVVEAMAYRTRDVIEAVERGAGIRLEELRIDGGASVMDGLCQFQADLLGLPVTRAGSAETTALGAAMLAAVGEDLIEAPTGVEAAYRPGRCFNPAHPGERPGEQYQAWKEAVERVRSHQKSQKAR